MKKQIRDITINDEHWKYIAGPLVITIWSPRDAKGSPGTTIAARDLRELNEAEGRYAWAYTPGSIRAAVEVLILKTRSAIPKSAKKKCGRCGKSREDARERVDPFTHEIHSKTVIQVMCEDCYHERSMDI